MFNTIVVGTDGSLTADRAVRRAADLARMCSARLHLVSAYRPPGDMALIGPMGMAVAAGTEEEVRAEVEAMLQAVGKEIAAEGVSVSLHASAGHAADAILDVAEREQADLIVVGNRG